MRSTKSNCLCTSYLFIEYTVWQWIPTFFLEAMAFHSRTQITIACVLKTMKEEQPNKNMKTIPEKEKDESLFKSTPCDQSKFGCLCWKHCFSYTILLNKKWHIEHFLYQYFQLKVWAKVLLKAHWHVEKGKVQFPQKVAQVIP